METVTLDEMPQVAHTTGQINSELKSRKREFPHFTMVLRSQVRARERWYVDALEDRPRLAAAVELVLRSEKGIDYAHANPLTGQVLIHYQADLVSEPIEALISRAIEFGPMSRDEFSMMQSLQSKSPQTSCFKRVMAMEAGCSAVQMFLLGGFCPVSLIAAGIFLFMHRRH